MKVLALLFTFGASLAWSAPLAHYPTVDAKQFQSDAIQVSRYIGPSNYPGYLIYNYLQIDQNRGIPISVYPDGSSSITHLQPTYNYYGTPVYDYRYQFNQIYPGFPSLQPPQAIPGQQPSLIPAQGPIYPPTTQKPIFEVDDGIEKLDETLDPSLSGIGNSHPNDDEDTVTIDAV